METYRPALESQPMSSVRPDLKEQIKESPEILTVSELTQQVKGVVEPRFSEVWVKGEVSNFRPASSGHAYFSLKDARSTLSAAIFGWGKRTNNKFQLKDGIEVACRGKISLYAPRGTYQIVIDFIQPVGAGALQAAFEKLKMDLHAEGLFDPQKKKMLPKLPLSIAVITSPSGAAIQDMLHVLNRRAPQIKVLVVPALVQGSSASVQIRQALELVNRHQLAELIVLARGGGSMEDLWCFNDEKLARAISKSKLPVVSAVGHEIDFTISDFVSDVRAPTPSAAAEVISAQWVFVRDQVVEAERRIHSVLIRDLAMRRELLSHIKARLVSPKDRLIEQTQKLDELSARLERAVRHQFVFWKNQFSRCMVHLDALSPLRVLERGYTLVRDSDDETTLLKSSKDLRKGQKLRITFFDGERLAKVTD